MTATVINERFDSVPRAEENVKLTIYEGSTFVSRLSKPEVVQITAYEDSDAILNYTLSGRTITFHESVGSGVNVSVTIKGKM